MQARYKGFTLIEMLIAMAILAIAMGALLQTAAQHAFSSNALRDRTIAQWVAANKLAEFQVAESWPDVGKSRGEAEMADTVWYWQAEILKVNDEFLRRIEISVRKQEDDPNSLYTLPGFLASPAVYAGDNESDEQ